MRECAIGSTTAENIGLAFTTISGLLLSGGVIAFFVYLLLTVASMVTIQPVFAQSSQVEAGVRLQAGIEKEDVDGDLKSAMDIYQKIAADTLAPRDVRAQALLRLAGCDEKLGKQAKQVYEQIVHDYADMPAAAQARGRLALLKQQEHPALPTTMSARKIETSGLGELYSWATDGERAVYRAPDGNLYVGDVAGHNKRLIFRAQQRKLDGWRPSPDFSMIELLFESRPGEPGSLAVIKSDGTGYRELIHDDAQNILPHSLVTTLDWSWDNRYLLLLVLSPNGSRLFVLSAADGQQREVKLPDSSCLSRAAFSPNGEFIAYETMPACDLTKTGTRRTFVMPMGGGETHLVYESRLQAHGSDNLFKDWTADGHYLIIHDLFGRFGKLALFLLPMKDGVAAGAPQLIRYGDDFGEAWTAASGTFVYVDDPTRPPGADVFQASLDEGDHPGRWQRLDLRGGRFPGGDRSVSFSPDGTELLYQAPSTEAGKTDLVVREVSTGRERVLYKLSGEHINCMHAASSPTVLCASSDKDLKTTLVSVAEPSGEIGPLATFDRPRIILQHSRDDKTIYFDSLTYDGPGSIFQWDVAARKETALAPSERGEEVFAPSPDGKWLVWIKQPDLLVRPMSGGQWKTLASEFYGIGRQVVVSPDSNWVIYHDPSATGEDWLSRVPIAGGKPERLGEFPRDCGYGYFSMSPDGRQLVTTCFGQPKGEQYGDVWVLENYLPVATK